MYHALALILIGVFSWMRSASLANAAGWSMIGGIVCFSGSLYILALGGPKIFGPITPLGGLMFMAGWGMFAVAAIQHA